VSAWRTQNTVRSQQDLAAVVAALDEPQ